MKIKAIYSIPKDYSCYIEEEQGIVIVPLQMDNTNCADNYTLRIIEVILPVLRRYTCGTVYDLVTGKESIYIRVPPRSSTLDSVDYSWKSQCSCTVIYDPQVNFTGQNVDIDAQIIERRGKQEPEEVTVSVMLSLDQPRNYRCLVTE